MGLLSDCLGYMTMPFLLHHELKFWRKKIFTCSFFYYLYGIKESLMTLCLDYISQASKVAPALNKMNEKIQQTIPKQENMTHGSLLCILYIHNVFETILECLT